jgi:hypothetical protein
MHDTAYLAITYCKRIHNYLGTSKGSIFNVHLSDGFGVLIQSSSSGKRLLLRGTLIKQTLSNEELLIVLRRQINFDRDQKSGRDGPNNWPRSIVGHLWFIETLLRFGRNINFALFLKYFTQREAKMCNRVDEPAGRGVRKKLQTHMIQDFRGNRQLRT